MQLTLFTDASLRILMHLARQPANQLATTAELAQLYHVPFNHLNKAAGFLSRAGWVQASRGRGGGLKLAVPATEIILGAVVRATEPQTPLVNCPTCPLQGHCELQRALSEATRAFYAVLDRYTLDDLARGTMTLLMPASQGDWRGAGPKTLCDHSSTV
ncbi:Rrf2 family transcriptional regulator [Deinococcus sp. HMF7620]|uniref:Rrf2 family transcriptional regulator n=1 Tax=Deinococcus arboris TaxID=2682977 RepID=A0A7C9LSJ5_9DEIO|nr:Rrf2 family transcriptional regulator [Deinococcus arboris]MVN88221.1 Rrf2 family transcriptional regulator [Deinococcus arboris]